MANIGYGCFGHHNEFVRLGAAIFYKRSKFKMNEENCGVQIFENSTDLV